jgi:hypothetical protein
MAIDQQLPDSSHRRSTINHQESDFAFVPATGQRPLITGNSLTEGVPWYVWSQSLYQNNFLKCKDLRINRRVDRRIEPSRFSCHRHVLLGLPEPAIIQLRVSPARD